MNVNFIHRNSLTLSMKRERSALIFSEILLLLISFYFSSNFYLQNNPIMVAASHEDITKDQLYADDFPTSYNSQNLMSNKQLTKICDFDFSYGAMEKIFVKENYVYSILENGGLLIFDTSISSKPTLIGSFNEFQINTGGFVGDNLIYLGIFGGGSAIINVSDPYNPVKISTLKDVNIVNKFYVSNDLFFTLDGFNRILVYNISNPLRPVLLSLIDYYTQDFTRVNDFSVKGDLLYILFITGLVIVDISDPENPIELVKHESVKGLSFDFKDDYVLTTSVFRNNSISFCQLNIHDFTDPFTIKNISSLILNTTVYNKKVQVINNSAFIYDAEFIIVNVSEISSPEVIGFYSQISLPSQNRILYLDINECFIDYEKEIIYCADFGNGLLIFDFINYPSLFLKGFFDSGGKITDVFVKDKFVYISDVRESYYNPTSKFSIYKTEHNFSSITLLGEYYPNGRILDFIINEQYVYLSVLNSGIEIINISNPMEPQLVNTYNNSLKYLNELVIDSQNNILYTTVYDKGLVILNISNPKEPQLITEYMQMNDWNYKYSEFCLADELLIVKIAGNDYGTGFSILNISNPSQPAVLWSGYISRYVTSLSVFDDLLIVGKHYNIVEIYDISDPISPELLSSVSNNWFFSENEIVTKESSVFVARGENGLLIVDIEHPKMARLVTTMKDHYSGESFDVFVQGDYVFLADGWDGLEIFKLDSYKLRFVVFFVPIGGIIIVSFIIFTNIRKTKKYKLTMKKNPTRCYKNFNTFSMLFFFPLFLFLLFLKRCFSCLRRVVF